jgi:hypothetical protein
MATQRVVKALVPNQYIGKFFSKDDSHTPLRVFEYVDVVEGKLGKCFVNLTQYGALDIRNIIESGPAGQLYSLKFGYNETFDRDELLEVTAVAK